MLRRIEMFGPLIVVIAGCVSATAQFPGDPAVPVSVTTSNAIGEQPYVTYGGVRENINLSTGNLNLRVPLLHLPGRNGLDLDLGLIYDSRIYVLEATWDQTLGQFLYDWYGQSPSPIGPGWRLDWPTLSDTLVEVGHTPNTSGWCDTSFILTLGGSNHPFSKRTRGSMRVHGNRMNCITMNTKTGQTWPAPQANINVTDATDASFVRLDTTNPADVAAHTKDGLSVHFNSPNFYGDSFPANKIEDANGNTITATNSYNVVMSITDSVGRVVTFGYNAGGALTSVSYKDSNGQTRTITINYAPVSVTSSLTNPVGSATGSFNVPSYIVLPNNRSFSFQYNTFGELSTITYPTGGYTRYDYATYQNFMPQADNEDYRELTARHECRDTAGACTPSTEDTTSYVRYEHRGGKEVQIPAPLQVVLRHEQHSSESLGTFAVGRHSHPDPVDEMQRVGEEGRSQTIWFLRLCSQPFWVDPPEQLPKASPSKIVEIFGFGRGSLLDLGTPKSVIARREKLRIAGPLYGSDFSF